MHRRLLLLTRDTRLGLIATILTGLLAGILTIGQSYILSTTVSGVFLGSRTLSDVWPWMRLLLGVVAGRGLLIWINEVSANSVAVHIKADLRERLFAHILALGPPYTRGERTGDLTAAAVEGIEALDAYFSQYLPQLVISALVPISILLIVLPLDPLSGIVLLLTAPLIPFFMFMIGRGAEVVTGRQYETLSRLSAHFLDSLQGLTTLKLFGQSKAQARNIAAVSDQHRDVTLKVIQVTFLSAFALELLATLGTAIIAVEVGLRLLYGHMQFQEALFLLILAPEFYLPLRMLGLRFHAGMAGTSAARRIFQVLDTKIENREQRIESSKAGEERNNQTTESGAAQPGSLATEPAFRTLELSNLSYTYPGESQPALKGVSLKIYAGQSVALVGVSGAGKSTLANILLRFVEPSRGDMLLNGEPLDRVQIDRWRAQLAWVPQNPHLFHDTIAANIRLGKPEASDEEMACAARSAHLEDFIQSLPEKYQTEIGEAGARLSSGQAQRLALARAFLKDAPILILDEPTSSLDPETEAQLEESTRRLMAGRTVITIAHRLNTVIHADQIVVLEGGQIVEQGRHAELLELNGVYARTVRVQGVGHQWHDDSLCSNSLIGNDPSGRDAWKAPIHLEPVLTPPGSPLQRAGAGKGGQPIRAAGASAATTSVFLRLLSFLNDSWGWVGLSVLLGSLTIGAGVALMGSSSWLISMAALHPSIAALEVAIIGVRLFGISRAVLRYLERLVSHNVTLRLLGRLRAWFYEGLEPLAPARLMRYQAGDLLARVIGDVNTLENFYVRVVAPPVTAFLVCVGTSLFLAASDFRLAVLLVACFLLLGVVLPLIVQAASNRDSIETVILRAELQVQLVDGIQGLPDILAFGQGPERLAKVRAIGAQYGDGQRRMARVNGIQAGAFTILSGLAMWFVLLITIPLVSSGHVAGIMLAPLILVTSASFEAVAPLPLAAQMWGSARAAARRLFEVVDAEPAVEEADHPISLATPTISPRPNLEFSDVSFSYAGNTTPALNHISFRLEPGQKLAIVGPSGAGKSTLVNLLLRFWDFESGEICLDGRSLKTYAADEVREKIALVSPGTYFFNTSVYENLRMARRRVTREDVETAAQAAQIHDLIVKLPKGYDTLIGEQGLRLSGGERQRMAIARAIIKDAPILVLDEPTANLDAITEERLLTILFQLMKKKTTLLITHRLIGLENVDEILVMEHGCIVERGSQASLLRGDGLYRRLWNLQNRLLIHP